MRQHPESWKAFTTFTQLTTKQLLQSLRRVTEEIKRLEKFLETNSHLPNFQQGFLRRHGSGHQLRLVVEAITDNMNRRCHTAAVYLYILQAFDRFWHDGLIASLI